MKTRHRVIAAVLLATIAGASQAKTAAEPLTDCVDLGAGHQTGSFGTPHLLVADGDAYYRLSFGGNCGAIGLPDQLQIATNGQANRLCPRGSRVSSRRGSCSVLRVEHIDAERFARYQRTGH